MIAVRERLAAILTDDKKRKELQYLAVFSLLGLVALFMTVLNLFTHKGALTWATGIFAVLCLVNFLLVRLGKGRCIPAAALLFGVEIVVLFTFFLVSGNPDGFSAIWIAMLPACGLLLFGRKRGTVLCAVMFAILVFLFWIPAGRALLRYDYSATFLARFPILYAAFYLLSLLLETIRSITQNELDKLRDKYRYYAAHDYLTNLLNRQGMLEWQAGQEARGEQAALMADIDHFKRVNDSYGHEIGDLVLASVAREIDRTAGSRVCRWGGEEFVVWYPDSAGMCDPEEIRKAIEAMEVKIPGSEKVVRVTVSIGAAKGTGGLKELVRSADEAMLRAKEKGRNRVEYQY